MVAALVLLFGLVAVNWLVHSGFRMLARVGRRPGAGPGGRRFPPHDPPRVGPSGQGPGMRATPTPGVRVG